MYLRPPVLVILATRGGSYMNLAAEIDNFSTTDGGVGRFLHESDSGGHFIVAAWGLDQRHPCIKHVDKVDLWLRAESRLWADWRAVLCARGGSWAK
ncbi:hypothetical protein TSUD_88640 [Trifolium subterraneum]|uniref:Uncharacterized protein n=1 Tax=Trifolium subterraneum TaxID=3900 RepID=A0A2Z6NXQ9_TRISU|nr:hypothetical protein TSUD_88640 [Trifolium subterraneum]